MNTGRNSVDDRRGIPKIYLHFPFNHVKLRLKGKCRSHILGCLLIIYRIPSLGTPFINPDIETEFDEGVT